jgi:hypothetical protein
LPALRGWTGVTGLIGPMKLQYLMSGCATLVLALLVLAGVASYLLYKDAEQIAFATYKGFKVDQLSDAIDVRGLIKTFTRESGLNQDRIANYIKDSRVDKVCLYWPYALPPEEYSLNDLPEPTDSISYIACRAKCCAGRIIPSQAGEHASALALRATRADTHIGGHASSLPTPLDSELGTTI